ncbi:hypothetical protein AB0M20_33800 [Actinoplanes sp. NPDC051633]|uniref:hypothetical protein n=1 Tax=Actinoplanes sp. NPDC051633 TaxID=3155670 RepID=UPI00343B3C2B
MPVETFTGPYLTLGGLARYLNASPSERRPVLAKLKKDRLKPGRKFDPHAKFYTAIRNDLIAGDSFAHVRQVHLEAPQHHAPSYIALAAGWEKYLCEHPASSRQRLARVRNARVERQGLIVNVNPRFGIAWSHKHVDVVSLWLDQQPLSEHAGLTIAALMQSKMRSLCLGGTSTVVDVRRSCAFEAHDDQDLLCAFDSEAATVVDLWDTDPAAA